LSGMNIGDLFIVGLLIIQLCLGEMYLGEEL